MYLKHFGLAQYPFSLSPDTSSFQKLKSHQQIFDLIIQALEAPGCFSKISGELGVGKTTLCRKLLQSLESFQHRYPCIHISNPILDEQGLLRALATELKLSLSDDDSYSSLLKSVSRHLVDEGGKGKITLILIDEAQAMPEETLKSLQLLAQLNHSSKSFHIALFGQPEFTELLELPELREMRKELQNSAEIVGLGTGELESYIQSRLKKAGYSGMTLFSKAALDKLYEGSRGIPRMVNIIAHKSMMLCMEKGEYSIDPLFVQDATENKPITTDEANDFLS